MLNSRGGPVVSPTQSLKNVALLGRFEILCLGKSSNSTSSSLGHFPLPGDVQFTVPLQKKSLNSPRVKNKNNPYMIILTKMHTQRERGFKEKERDSFKSLSMHFKLSMHFYKVDISATPPYFTSIDHVISYLKGILPQRFFLLF